MSRTPNKRLGIICAKCDRPLRGDDFDLLPNDAGERNPNCKSCVAATRSSALYRAGCRLRSKPVAKSLTARGSA